MPDADLKAIYPKVMRRSTSLTLFLMSGWPFCFPDMKIESKSTEKVIEVLKVEDIPRRIRRSDRLWKGPSTIETEDEECR